MDVDTTEKKISVRPGDIEMSKPFGVAAWQTSVGAARDQVPAGERAGWERGMSGEFAIYDLRLRARCGFGGVTIGRASGLGLLQHGLRTRALKFPIERPVN